MRPESEAEVDPDQESRAVEQRKLRPLEFEPEFRELQGEPRRRRKRRRPIYSNDHVPVAREADLARLGDGIVTSGRLLRILLALGHPISRSKLTRLEASGAVTPCDYRVGLSRGRRSKTWRVDEVLRAVEMKQPEPTSDPISTADSPVAEAA